MKPASGAWTSAVAARARSEGDRTIEERVGTITGYYAHIGVAVVHLTDGNLRVGDQIRIRGHTTDFARPVESLQVEHQAVERAERDAEVALKVRERVRRHDQVLRVTDA